MKSTVMSIALAAFGLSAAVLAPVASAQEKVLNLYSARHYQTDEKLYSDFTAQTGIKINRIEAGDEPLLERLRAEGANSPADVVMLVDAARLWKAQQEGLFAPITSSVLNSKIPAQYRSEDNTWFGFSTRARVIVYNKATVKAAEVDSYEKLAAPVNKGKVCTRSGSHPYMLSMVSSIMSANGVAKTEEWAKGMVANMARAPKGGDTDQIRAVASGECGVALTNTYYWVRMMRSDKAEDKEVVSKVGFIWPNQADRGTHMNISGAAVAKHSKNKDAAQKFMEYLASDSAQTYFAQGNNEWPVVTNAPNQNIALKSLGNFKADPLSIAVIGRSTSDAQKLLDRAAYK